MPDIPHEDEHIAAQKSPVPSGVPQWEVYATSDVALMANRLNGGWEFFAATGGRLYFKRLVR